MPTPPPPERTPKERRYGLLIANQIRALRARDKERIKRREIDARQILLHPPEYWEKAHLAVLVRSIPGVGHTKVEKIFDELGIAPAKTVNGITDAQRERLAEELERFYGTRRRL